MATDLCVRELLVEMSDADVALRLRASLQACTPAAVADRARWLQTVQRCGAKAVFDWDTQALTFIVSSWGFDWEGADFDGRHGDSAVRARSFVSSCRIFSRSARIAAMSRGIAVDRGRADAF